MSRLFADFLGLKFKICDSDFNIFFIFKNVQLLIKRSFSIRKRLLTDVTQAR